MKKKKGILFAVTIFIMFLFCIPCYGASGKYEFTLDRTITNATTKFVVRYENLSGNTEPENPNSGYDETGNSNNKMASLSTVPQNASLYVTVNGKVAFRKKCQPLNPFVTVTMSKPKAGDVVRISLKAPGWKSNAKKIVVKKITSIVPSKRSGKVKTPVVKMKRTARGIYAYHITARKGQTVIIRNGEKIIKKIKFTRNCTVAETCILGNLNKSEVYIYAMEKGYRSASYVMLPRNMGALPETL